ncbi:hypothetical protein FHR92_001040 [Fontibacillus solani]|uniref:Uncharacterized protein n=1 Tax=Fontibacillus solani TaxID=1572857 RepID=A0A7W3SQZ9_9BACL|nr:hypothetical protein [Fontibacillus solani]MBA9084583.1 hypothetical protein [Fontibacillus solani]
MQEKMVAVDLWFPDSSNHAQDIFEVPYQTLMLWLATDEIYLTEYSDIEKEDGLFPHYVITKSIFQTDVEPGDRVVIYTDYAKK